MRQDSGGGTAEREHRERSGSGWRGWISSPRNALAAGAGAVALGLLVGYLFVLAFVFPPGDVASGLIHVPDVIGRTTEDARRAIERAGLVYQETAGFHESKSAGIVVAQDPLPGERAARTTPVRVTPSLGPKRSLVPDVIGLDHVQASEALARAGYRSDPVWVDADADVGQVVGMRPRPGTPVELPATLRLMVSAGPPTVVVPDLASRSLAEARTMLERLGLQLGETSSDSSSLAAPGTVLSQSPEAGASVKRGAEISVTVATAPTLEGPDTAVGDTLPENIEGTDWKALISR